MTLSGWARLWIVALGGLVAAMPMAGCVIGKWRSYSTDRSGAEKAAAMLAAQSKEYMGIEFSHASGRVVNLYSVTQVNDDRICGTSAGSAGEVSCYSFADIKGDLRVWDGKGNALDAVVDTVTLPARAVGKVTR